jgi:hypothetical protein
MSWYIEYKHNQRSCTILPHLLQPSMSQLTLRRNSPHSTTHKRPTLFPVRPRTSTRLSTEKNKLPTTTGTPPGNAAMCPVHIHLPATQCLPESIHADMAHAPIGNCVDELRGEGEPLFQIVYAEEGERVD